MATTFGSTKRKNTRGKNSQGGLPGQGPGEGRPPMGGRVNTRPPNSQGGLPNMGVPGAGFGGAGPSWAGGAPVDRNLGKPGLGWGMGGRFGGVRSQPPTPVTGAPNPAGTRGGPRPGWYPPDLNGPERGLGYGKGYGMGAGGRFAGPTPTTGGRIKPPWTATEGVESQWGAGNAYDAGSTSDQIARNEYLNSLPVGGPREAAMNAMGYWSGGVPQEARPYSGSAPESLAPGEVWQAQQAGGGYAGAYTGQAGGAPVFTQFGTPQVAEPGGGGLPGPGRRGRVRRRRR